VNVTTFPRPLSPRERDLVEFLLTGDFPGVEALREQARQARVIGRCDCGCPTIDLAIDREHARPAQTAHRVPVSAPAAGWAPFEILLLVDDDGWIDSLEYVDYTGTPPADFPPRDAFEPPIALSAPSQGHRGDA
jgi:hypothetical protein